MELAHDLIERPLFGLPRPEGGAYGVNSTITDPCQHRLFLTRTPATTAKPRENGSSRTTSQTPLATLFTLSIYHLCVFLLHTPPLFVRVPILTRPQERPIFLAVLTNSLPEPHQSLILASCLLFPGPSSTPHYPERTCCRPSSRSSPETCTPCSGQSRPSAPRVCQPRTRRSGMGAAPRLSWELCRGDPVCKREVIGLGAPGGCAHGGESGEGGSDLRCGAEIFAGGRGA
ncbi:hypothetical protein VUR80DRAFT_2566 [Thermomyces stellatus]